MDRSSSILCSRIFGVVKPSYSGKTTHLCLALDEITCRHTFSETYLEIGTISRTQTQPVMDQTHLSFQRGQEAWLAEFEK